MNPTIVSTNTLSLNAHRNMGLNAVQQSRSMQRLSSGFRINSAADDSAGFGIATLMRAQIRGIDQASRNAQDAISLVQTAEGGMASINEMIIRLRTLVVQAANDTNIHEIGNHAQSDRVRIQDEINQIIGEIDVISQRIEFNTRILLSGNYRRQHTGFPLFNPLPHFFYIRHPRPPVEPDEDEDDEIEDITQTSITATAAPPLNPIVIDFNNLVTGASGAGWEYTGGVLRIIGDGDFRINGNGTVAGDRRIEVQSGVTADIILSNVHIGAINNDAMDMRNATVNLWLEGTNVLEAFFMGADTGLSGIRTSGGNLTIGGDGYLTARGSPTVAQWGPGAAGIGGGTGEDAGSITIISGNITASGGWGAAGIGSGDRGTSDVTITGGNINATGGSSAAGIGSGFEGISNIIITSGYITATGGAGGAGIGSGFTFWESGFESRSDITISGGTITATGGINGAGIGSGSESVSSITITYGDITATGGLGGWGAAGIGSGPMGMADITIQDGRITATGGVGGAGIGTGFDGAANITITGGDILAVGSAGAGIGAGTGGGKPGGNDITITGGNIVARGTYGGAGIGGGGFDGSGFNITINGGYIRAYSDWAAGIGNGINSPFIATITINGGHIRATGGMDTTNYLGTHYGAAAIGGSGLGGVGAILTITGGLVEIGPGQWIGGGLLGPWGTDDGTLSTGSTDIRGGNLSIHDPNLIHNLLTHFHHQPAFRVEIFLEDENGNPVSFGNLTDVTYTINGLTVNAITDSYGRLFMYLPESFAGQEGIMTFGGRIFRGYLSMNPDHNNELILRIPEEETNGPNGPPDNGNNGGDDEHRPRPPSETWPPVDELPELAPRPRGRSLHFQIGPNSGHSLFVNIDAMDAESLGLRRGNLILIDVLREYGRNISPILNILDSALTHATRERSSLGSIQNRLEFTIQSLGIASENLSSAESRIRDADMARETMRLTRANVLQQASVSMLAQANQGAEDVRQLLGV